MAFVGDARLRPASPKLVLALTGCGERGKHRRCDIRSTRDTLREIRGASSRPRLSVARARDMGFHAPTMDATARRILSFDSAGGLCVGAVVLALSGFVSERYGLPITVVWFVGAANVVYGIYSGSLVRVVHAQGRLGRPWVTALVIANLGWSCVCIALITRHWSTLTPLGVFGLAFEALFVGGLAALEFKRVRPRTTPRHPDRR